MNNHERRKSANKGLWIAIVFVVGLSVVSLFTGAYDIFNQPDGWEMFFITRVPRTVALMLSGSAMAMSGLVMQLLTQNRFVEPTTTGTIEWAGLGLLFVYLLVPAPSLILRMLGAIVFSFIGTMIFFLFINRIRLRSSLIVPVVGMMMGAVVSAISSFLGLVFNMTQSIEGWFQGSFAGVERGRYEFLWLVLVVAVLIYWYANHLTIAGLGEEIATNLGLNHKRILLMGTVFVALVVGIVSAVIGNLPFLGIIVPNIVSMYRGDHLRENLVWVALLGMGTILVSDIVSRTIIMPFEVPVSLILGTLGAVVFIVILLKQRRQI